MMQNQDSLNAVRQSDVTNTLCNSENFYRLKLSLVSGVGPILFHRIVKHFGSANEVFDATLSQLSQVGQVGPQIAAQIRSSREDGYVERVIQHCEEHSIRILFSDDSEIPPLLKELPNCPAVLYVKGSFKPLDELSIGIVGTRHATQYGKQSTELFARGLSRAGFTIISGLARGIDSVAHRAALEVQGRTIAVLGSSLTEIYPKENEELAREIAETGAVISETPPFAKTNPGVFPQRNRLISGLSLGIIVVEAAERSGALITATHAGEQGRDVFAVPGSIQSRASRGCNRLIRDGAILVQDPNDVIDHLGPLFQRAVIDDEQVVVHPTEMMLNDTERLVLQAIQFEPTDIDIIVAKCGLSISQVLATISVLQMRKLINRLSARLVQRKS